MIGVYKITNTVNGKSYVGCSTANVERRIQCHFRGNRGSKLIKSAIDKYGQDKFIYEILEECDSKDVVKDRERYWISFYNTIAPNGYNLTTGGEGYEGWHFAEEVNLSRKPHTQETKDKISKALSGQKRNEEQLERIRVAAKIRNSNPEIREKISKANINPDKETRLKMSISQKERFKNSEASFKGCHHTEEVKKHLSDIAKLKVGELNNFYGKTHSEETKQKLSKAKSDSNKGRCWFTNGFENKFLNLEEGTKLIQENSSWKKGRSQYWKLSSSSTIENVSNEEIH